MTRSSIQYVVTVDGCPYAAGSASCSASVTSSDTDWPAGVTVLPGALSASTKLSWSESIRPVSGETSVSGMSFLFDDIVPSTGVASGERVWTWLFSRRPRNMLRAALSASISASDTSIVVASDPGFASGVIWIDREAINCSGYNAGTKTFTVSTRGYLGTRAQAHAIDLANAFTPVVWASWPGPAKRRVILWVVEGTTATAVWRGYCGRAPRLDDSGARWELQCDHALTVQSARSLGPSRSSVRLVGFDPSTLNITLNQTNGSGATLQTFSVLREPYAGDIPETLEDCLSLLTTRLNSQLLLAGAGIAATVTSTVTSEGFPRVESRANLRHLLYFTARGLRPGSAQPRDVSPAGEPFDATEQSAGVWVSRRTLAYPARAHIVLRNGELGTYPVDSTQSLPTSGLVTNTTDGTITTSVQWALAGSDSAGFAFSIALSSVTAATRRIAGWMRRSTVDARASRGGTEITGDILVTEPTPLQLVTVVESGHWLRAIQRGVLSTDYGLGEQADPRDWSWTTADEVVSATAGERTASKVWVFDGSVKLGDFLRDTLRLDACAIATRGSRLAVIPMAPALPTDEVALAIDLTAGDGIHQRPPSFGTLPEGIVNSVKLTRDAADGPPITVNNQSSIALYGLAPALEIEAKGAVAEVIEGRTPFELLRGPFSRLIGLWGSPSDVVTIDVPAAHVTALELGNVVRITSKTIPDGDGHRGISTVHRGRVYRRDPDLNGGVMKVDVLISGSDRGAGYAPAIRVDSFSGGSNKTITAATGYLTAATSTDDYAGSALVGYPGTSGDGGVYFYAVNNVVRFRRVDTTGTVEEGGFVVTAVDPTTGTLEINSDPSAGAHDWVTLLAGGAVIDLIPDVYSAVVAAQQDYAYVGSKSALDLGGDDLQEWSP